MLVFGIVFVICYWGKSYPDHEVLDTFLCNAYAWFGTLGVLALKEACAQLNLAPEDCLYMGDDWPDLSAFAIAGMKITVPNGHVEVRRRADLVTQAYGGRGAVREICDMLLMSKGVYQELLEKYLAAPL